MNVTKSIAGYLWGLVSAFVLAQIFTVKYFWYQLMLHVAWGMIPLVGFWVAANVFLGMWMSKHPNPRIQQIAKVYERIFAYTAPFQGCFFTTLVFWVMGSVDIGEIQPIFLFDWEYGMSYSAWLVFGVGFALPLLFFERRILSGLFIALCSWGLVIAFFFYEEAMRAFALEHPFVFSLGITGSQLLMSIFSMHALFNGNVNGSQKQKKQME